MVLERFGMQGSNYFSSAHCVPRVQWNIPKGTRSFHLSTFESISLTPDSWMQQKGVPTLYELSRTVLPSPSLYVCPVENILGRVPLIPCYLDGNTSNTTPHMYRGAIPAEAAADSRREAGSSTRRSTYGCGATGKCFHWMWLWQKLWP